MIHINYHILSLISNLIFICKLLWVLEISVQGPSHCDQVKPGVVASLLPASRYGSNVVQRGDNHQVTAIPRGNMYEHVCDKPWQAMISHDKP